MHFLNKVFFIACLSVSFSHVCFAPKKERTTKRVKKTCKRMTKKTFACSQCTKSFDTKADYKTHSSHTHYSCSLCNQIIISEGFVRAHNMAFHGGSDSEYIQSWIARSVSFKRYVENGVVEFDSNGITVD